MKLGMKPAVTVVALALAPLAAAPLALAGPVTTQTVTMVKHGACGFRATIAWPATPNLTKAVVRINTFVGTVASVENDFLTPNKAGKLSIAYKAPADSSSHGFTASGGWWDGTWHDVSGNTISAYCSAAQPG